MCVWGGGGGGGLKESIRGWREGLNSILCGGGGGGGGVEGECKRVEGGTQQYPVCVGGGGC